MGEIMQEINKFLNAVIMANRRNVCFLDLRAVNGNVELRAKVFVPAFIKDITENSFIYDDGLDVNKKYYYYTMSGSVSNLANAVKDIEEGGFQTGYYGLMQ